MAATKPFDEDNGEDMMQMEKIYLFNVDNGEDMMQMEKIYLFNVDNGECLMQHSLAAAGTTSSR